MFLIGFVSCAVIVSAFYVGFELPLGDGNLSNASAPSDWIKQGQIKVYNDKIVIELEDASLSKYAATGSMEPVLDEYSNGIRIRPVSEKQIEIGDIISFKQEGFLIVHRVVDKGEDEQGVYFIAKGDNNNVSDGKIRFKDIRYVTVVVLL